MAQVNKREIMQVRSPRVFVGFSKSKHEMLSSVELARSSVAINREGVLQHNSDIILLEYSGMNDDQGTMVYELDVLDVDVPNEFGSLMRRRGVMRWVKPGMFSIWLLDNTAIEVGNGVPLESAVVVGNALENTSLLDHEPES